MATEKVNDVDGTRTDELGFHDVDELLPYGAIKWDTIVKDRNLGK